MTPNAVPYPAVGQGAGIAVSEDGLAPLNEVGTMATHCFTQGDIFVEYGLRLAQQGRFDRRDRLGAQGSEFALHPVDSPKKIDRCRVAASSSQIGTSALTNAS